MTPPDIHPSALCASSDLGPGCVVGPLSVVGATARLGAGVHIGSHAMVPDGVILGDAVRIGDGARLCSGLVAEEDVVVGANTVFHESDPLVGPPTPTRLFSGAIIGANATLLGGLTVGRGALVEDGAVVKRSVQAHAVVSGNPAIVTGFAGTNPSSPVSPQPVLPEVTPSLVRGVVTYLLPIILDPRGNLSVVEFEKTLPFRPRRFFMTFEVPSAHLRGEHAHRECHQFLLCVRGACAVVVDDGARREEYRLDTPTFGIHVPPMVWTTEYKHTPDSVLIVFASHHYDPDDYVRDYGVFLQEVGNPR